jgi:HSP20 family protein
MSLSRWEPIREMMALRDAVDRLFEETFSRPNGEGLFAQRALPPLDIYEKDGTIRVEVPLPGTKPEEVDVTLMGNTLTIKGEKKSDEEIKEENYYRHEVRYGTFTRSVELPPTANLEKPEAKFENGILTLTFPKVPEAEPKRIPLEQ